MTSTTSDARPNEQHRVLTDLIHRQAGVVSPASDRVTVDRPSLMTPSDQLTLVTDRLHEILITGGTFDAIYRHILTAPGKRVRLRLPRRPRPPPTAAAVPPAGLFFYLACAMEMFHEALLVHDDICDGSLLRRGCPVSSGRVRRPHRRQGCIPLGGQGFTGARAGAGRQPGDVRAAW